MAETETADDAEPLLSWSILSSYIGRIAYSRARMRESVEDVHRRQVHMVVGGTSEEFVNNLDEAPAKLTQPEQFSGVRALGSFRRTIPA